MNKSPLARVPVSYTHLDVYKRQLKQYAQQMMDKHRQIFGSFYLSLIHISFMNLDEMMPAYAPKVFSMIEERDMIDHLKVNGNLCMVPSFTKEVETADLVVREDLRKKYNCPEIHSYDDLEAFLIAVKENEPSMFPLSLIHIS